MSGPRPRERALFALVCLVLASLPFLLVRVPPITDLPQQMAQIPLAMETLSGQAPEYRIQWLTPNKLSYLPLAFSWLLLEPFGAVALAMVLMAAVWIGSCTWLAARRGRPLEGAILATLLFFNQTVYFGFLNFTVGLAAFVYWFQEVADPPASPRGFRSLFTRVLVGSLLLYYSHVLWLVMGLVWLGLCWLVSRPDRRTVVATLAGAAPTLILTAMWYPSLAGQSWGETVSAYGDPPWGRLAFGDWVDQWFGGVAGALEPLTMMVLIVWVAVALWQHRDRLADAVDLRLLSAALLFIAAALCLPVKVQKTVFFSVRWMPVGAVFLLLALPMPRVGAILRRAIPLALLAVFTLVTAAIWIDFEREELAGFHESLESLSEEPLLLGLDFVRVSPRMKIPPYFQLPAYAQLLRGGRLGFSFVSLASSPVVKRDMGWTDPWTPALEWHPQFVSVSDLDAFDFTLVHGVEAQAVLQAKDPRLTPVTQPAPWRLFSVDHDRE